MYTFVEDLKILVARFGIQTSYLDTFASTKPLVYPGTINKKTKARRKLRAAENETCRKVFVTHVKTFVNKLLSDVDKYDDEKFGEESLYDILLNNDYTFAEEGDDVLKFDISAAFEKAQDLDLHTEFSYLILCLALECCNDEDADSLQELLDIIDFKPVSVMGANNILSAIPQMGHMAQIISTQISNNNNVVDGRALASALNMPSEAVDKLADVIGQIDINNMQNNPASFNNVLDNLASKLQTLRIPINN